MKEDISKHKEYIECYNEEVETLKEGGVTTGPKVENYHRNIGYSEYVIRNAEKILQDNRALKDTLNPDRKQEKAAKRAEEIAKRAYTLANCTVTTQADGTKLISISRK